MITDRGSHKRAQLAEFLQIEQLQRMRLGLLLPPEVSVHL